jgi:hypothetical protein
MLSQSGRQHQAASQFRDLLTDYLRVLGPDHPHTLTVRDQLAYWQDRQEAGGG